MKKYESILKRVEAYEKKCQIKYAKADGKLFAYLKWICLIAAAYMVAINLIAFVGFLFLSSRGINYIDKLNMVLLPVLTFVLLASVVMLFRKSNILKAVFLSILILCNIYFSILFGKLTYDGTGLLDLNVIFYVRHFPPLFLIFITAIWMLTIIIRQEYKLRFRYNKIITNLYNAYQGGHADDLSGMNDAEWQEFIENYDPSQLKNKMREG